MQYENYLHSISIVLDIISNLEMILSIWRLYKNTMPLYKGLDHPWILVSIGWSGVNPVGILKNDYTEVIYAFLSISWNW